MNSTSPTPTQGVASGGTDQRQALTESERKANEDQPGSFKEKETDEKVVSIPPIDKDDKPIGGLDPA